MMPNVKCHRSYLFMQHKLKRLTHIRKKNLIIKTKHQNIVLETHWLKLKTNELKVDEILYSEKEFLNLAILNNEIQKTLMFCDQYEELSLFLKNNEGN